MRHKSKQLKHTIELVTVGTDVHVKEKQKQKRVLCIKDIDDIANILLLSIQFLGIHNFIFCVIKLAESIKHLRLLKATGFGELNTNRHTMSQTQTDIHRMSGSIEIVRKKNSKNKRKLLPSVTVSAKLQIVI